ncbi:ETC complex I subunit [Pseudorhizobium endolithicum]|uniref:ETC complex I subunit n=2 Tax=Pseudorhizobium endolithicum TaxID=1191678 RepID=A0ABM8PLM3_9HYPH|nr:ETC complex I subunit [Pseudorhizobium endolithicum]
MEKIVRQYATPTELFAGLGHSNDNCRRSTTRSIFPADAMARIYKPARSVATSGTALTKGWRLAFEHRSRPFLDPLIGYTGCTDPLPQLELSFPTLRSAVSYAQRHGLTYVVQRKRDKCRAGAKGEATRRGHKPSAAFTDATLDRLGLGSLQQDYGQALDDADHGGEPARRETWSSPMQVVNDPTLSLSEKRSILMNWAWTEYLVDQATNEGMPEYWRPSRLDEVEQALLSLERQVGCIQNAGGRQAA